MTVMALNLGAAASLALVGLARGYPPQREGRVYGVGLMIAALIYVVFTTFGGACARWLALESLGVVIYGAAARVRVRGRPWLLATAWAAHVVWDGVLHLGGAGSEYTPR